MIRQYSFSTKIIILVALTILLPILIAIICLYNIWNNTLQEKTNDYLRNTADLTISRLEESIDYIERTALDVTSNDDIYNFLNNNEQSMLYRPEQVFAKYIVANDEIASIYIKSNDDRICSYTKYGYPVFMLDTLIEGVSETKQSWNIIDDVTFFKQDIVRYLKQDKMGELVIKINSERFYDVIKEIDYSNNGEVYLVNKDGIVIASKNQDTIGQKISDEYDALDYNREKIYTDISVEGVSNTIYSSVPTSNGWKLILYIPTSYYMSDIIYLQNNIIVFIAIVICFGIMTIIIVSKRVTRPLQELANEMEDIGRDEPREVKAPFVGNEIDSLNKSFRQMIDRISILTENEYHQKIIMQEAELRSLQMKINPHFLYNTLDTINWMSRIKGNDEIGDITSALGKLMRYSLSKKDYVYINEEIESLKSYMGIQKTRYGDRVSVTFDIEPNMGEYYIPKLLIQPILENAIIHGAENKMDLCEISVRVRSAGDDDIEIIIEDTGMGIDEDSLQKILNDDISVKKDHTSVGLINVKNRIKLIFGEDYGVSIESKIGVGTKIILHIGKLTNYQK